MSSPSGTSARVPAAKSRARYGAEPRPTRDSQPATAARPTPGSPRQGEGLWLIPEGWEPTREYRPVTSDPELHSAGRAQEEWGRRPHSLAHGCLQQAEPQWLRGRQPRGHYKAIQAAVFWLPRGVLFSYEKEATVSSTLHTFSCPVYTILFCYKVDQSWKRDTEGKHQTAGGGEAMRLAGPGFRVPL